MGQTGTVWKFVVAMCVMGYCSACALDEPSSPAFPVPGEVPAFASTGRPFVTSIRFSPTLDGRLSGVFAFSSPMNKDTVQKALRIAEVQGADTSTFALGGFISPESDFSWNTTGTTVTAFFTVPEQPVFRPVVMESATDTLNRRIDGTVHISEHDPFSLARSADDGYNSAVSHIGLPYYLEPGNLNDHPRYRLSFDRAYLSAEVFSTTSLQPVSTASEDGGILRLQGTPAKLTIRIQSENRRPLGDTTVERSAPIFFAIDALQHIWLEDASGTTIPSNIYFDDAMMAPGPVAVTFSSNIRFVGLQGAQGISTTTRSRMALLTSDKPNEELVHSVIPVTGGVLFDPYLYKGVGSAPVGVRTLSVPDAAWRANELQGQEFVGGLQNGIITSNRASELELDKSHIACTPSCTFTVSNRPSAFFRSGESVWLSADTITVEPVDPEAYSLPWTLHAKGGVGGIHDIYGVPIYDHNRDGDELAGGTVNDDYVWIVEGGAVTSPKFLK